MGKYLKYIFTVALVATLVSCEDEPDKYKVASGNPKIYYITQATAPDVLLEKASLGQVITIVGDNLRSVYEMYFNEVPAILNSSYMTDNTIILAIPQTIPEEVTDMIYFYNKKGEVVTYDFHVVVPPPVINTMSCEFAPAGEIVSLNGNYFVDDPEVPLEVVFPGNIVVNEFTSIDQYSISFEMPEVEEEGTVDVTTLYGTGTSLFHYLESRGFMFDFDEGGTGLTNHGWHGSPIIENPEDGICGNYIQFGDGSTLIDENTWGEDDFCLEYWPGDWSTPTDYPADGIRLFDLVDFTDYENMALKFELCVPSSAQWKSFGLQIIFAGTDIVTYGNGGTDVYGNKIAGPNNKYFSSTDADYDVPRALYRPWIDGVYDTDDKWITVVIPIGTDFTYNFNGKTSSNKIKSADFFASLVFFLCQGQGDYEVEVCTPILKIDNIRAVPYK